MASPKLLLATFLLMMTCSLLEAADFAPMTLTVVNNCPFPVWPGIQASSGNDVLEGGGFFLPALSHKSFPAPAHPWSGRIWARTGCTASGTELHCATGDCGGRLQCGGLGGAAPATLAQVSLHHGDTTNADQASYGVSVVDGFKADQASYGVSVVDGFNVGLSVTPHEGRGNCPVLACRGNLTQTCPGELQLRSPAGAVLACKSGCEAFRTDELCCRNMYNSPRTCRASKYSEFFKRECPQAVTYAHDSPSLTHQCAAPRELKVIFCH